MGHARTCPPHQDHLQRARRDPARRLADSDGCSCRTSPRNGGAPRAGRQPAEQPGGCGFFPGGTEPGVLAGSRALVWWAVSSALGADHCAIMGPCPRSPRRRRHGPFQLARALTPRLNGPITRTPPATEGRWVFQMGELVMRYPNNDPSFYLCPRCSTAVSWRGGKDPQKETITTSQPSKA
jgi:hypothetical protein